MEIMMEATTYTVEGGNELPKPYVRVNPKDIENLDDFENVNETAGSHNGGAGEKKACFLVLEKKSYFLMVQHCITGHTGKMYLVFLSDEEKEKYKITPTKVIN